MAWPTGLSTEEILNELIIKAAKLETIAKAEGTNAPAGSALQVVLVVTAHYAGRVWKNARAIRQELQKILEGMKSDD